MKSVASRARHGIDNSAGRTTIGGRIVAGYDREFLHSVRTQIEPQHATRRCIRVVVDGNSVQQIIVLLGAPAGNTDLCSKTTLSPAGTGICGVRLGANRGDACLKCGCLCPITPVNRHVAHSFRSHHSAHRGCGGRLMARPIARRLQGEVNHTQVSTCDRSGRGHIRESSHRSSD